MAFFGRRKQAPDSADRQDAAIADFWQWWDDEGARTWGQIAGTGVHDEAAGQMTERVHAIDPRLVWETGPGSESAHLLAVGAEGDPEVRAVARRWLLAAPDPDPIWSYADARQPIADLERIDLTFAGHHLIGQDAVVGVRRQGSRVDVTLHHPQFPELSADDRMRATFLILDKALGERVVETWIGELVPSEVAPLDGFGLAGLRAVVRDLAAEFTDEQGAPVWVSMQGEGPAGRVVALAQVPLAAAMWPTLDQHVLIEAAYGDRESDGQPTEAAVESLAELDAELEGAVRDDGMAVAFETSAGVRRAHVYVDSRSDALTRIERTVRAWDGSARVRADDDPGWAQVQHLRG